MSAAGEPLFGRVVRVEVGQAGAASRAWEGLRVSFEVKKSVGWTPNKATLEIYGLTRDSSHAFQEKDAVVRLAAGYGTPSELFLGDVDRAVREVSGTEAVTKVEASDGGRVFRRSWISKTFAAGSSSTQILSELVAAAGVAVVSATGFSEVLLTQPLVLNGPVRDCLDVLAKAVGAEWSIQGGELQLLPPGALAPGEGVLLTPQTGLVGSPVRTKTGVEVTCLLQPLIAPGQRFLLESRDFQGVYKAREVTHKGDSGWETDFYTRVVATLVG